MEFWELSVDMARPCHKFDESSTIHLAMVCWLTSFIALWLLFWDSSHLRSHGWLTIEEEKSASMELASWRSEIVYSFCQTILWVGQVDPLIALSLLFHKTWNSLEPGMEESASHPILILLVKMRCHKFDASFKSVFFPRVLVVLAS